jgi:hypothetical protein
MSNNRPIKAATQILAALIFAALVASLAFAETNSPPIPPPSDDEEIAEVTFIQKGRQHTHVGRIVIEAADGGFLFQTDDGALWPLQPQDILRRKAVTVPFEPVKADEMAERMLAELPPGFRTHSTPHYVVCYNTSREYAQWTSSLLERLHKAFTGYWKSKGFELREPEFPLVATVFADRGSYDAASGEDLPGGTGGIVGFYSLRSNRVNMFDLTGVESVRGSDARRGSTREINLMLSQPAAVPLVATIVHEATHQIAFNCGLQTRFADIPLWLCEGMAVYFEAPDLASTRGWRGIGKVNYPRLSTFRRNLRSWNDRSLESLIVDDRRLRNPRTAADAYADAWALNYYLIKYEPEAYSDYMKTLAAKPALIKDGRQTRLEEFQEHFGDLGRLEQEFLKQMARVR